MLIFSDISCIPRDMFEESMVFNMSSLYEGIERINIIPSYNGDLFSVEFDNYYANYIYNNDLVFRELMKIIMPLYDGKNVIVLVTRNDILDAVTESIIKIIQERYGYISNNIYSIEDTEYLVEGTFDVFGLPSLDTDKERLIRLITRDLESV